MKKTILISFCLVLSITKSGSLWANASIELLDHLGPFVPISINSKVVEDVEVDPQQSIALKIRTPYQKQIFTVKISDADMADYRYWINNGRTEFYVQSHQSGEKQGYTDAIRTTTKFIEYWLGKELVLHLIRLDE